MIIGMGWGTCVWPTWPAQQASLELCTLASEESWTPIILEVPHPLCQTPHWQDLTGLPYVLVPLPLRLPFPPTQPDNFPVPPTTPWLPLGHGPVW